MRKIPLSEAVPHLIVAATVITLLVVFLINAFPPLEEAVVIDDQSSVSESSSAVIREGNINGSVSSGASVSTSGSASSTSSSQISPQSDLININTASVEELMTLDGIGEVKAKAIVDYRAENGYFKSIDDLVLVSGIGEKTLEKNRDRITV